jgi:hypothetical protein
MPRGHPGRRRRVVPGMEQAHSASEGLADNRAFGGLGDGEHSRRYHARAYGTFRREWRRPVLGRWLDAPSRGLLHKGINALRRQAPALGGLARAISQRSGATYIAGLWDCRLLEALAWKVAVSEPDHMCNDLHMTQSCLHRGNPPCSIQVRIELHHGPGHRSMHR